MENENKLQNIHVEEYERLGLHVQLRHGEIILNLNDDVQDDSEFRKLF